MELYTYAKTWVINLVSKFLTPLPSFIKILPLAFLLLLGNSNAMGQATLSTDQPDYYPGSTVIITGSGFQPFESVQCQVQHTDGLNNDDPSHEPWQTIADEYGNINTTWLVPLDQDHPYDFLLLTADGLTSGLHAEVSFTDAPCPKPGITALSDQIVCEGTASVTFSVTASGTGTLSYQWYKNGVPLTNVVGKYAGVTTNTLTISNIVLADAATGGNSYSVIVTLVAGCGTTNDSKSAHLAVTPLPTATIAYTGSPYCSNAGNVTVTQSGLPTSGTYSYVRNSPGPGTLSINSTTGTVNTGSSTPGTYTVTYTVAASGGCSQYTTTASITINQLPSATITYSGSPYCSNSGTATVTRTGTSGGSYTSNAVSPAVLSLNSSTGAIDLGASTPGSYTVTYTIAAANGCSQVTTTANITITAAPSATISYAGTPYCPAPGLVSVTRTGSSGGSYSGSASGLKINAGSGAINLGTSDPGTYTVTYTIAASGGCALYSTTTSVTIHATPTGTISGTTTICNGQTTTLSIAATGTGTISGTLSDGTAFSGTAPTITVNVSPITTTTYTISTLSDANCSALPSGKMGSAIITVNQKSANPTSATASVTNICNGQSTILTLHEGGGGTGEVIKWYSASCGGTLEGTGNDLSVSPTTTTTYYGRYEDPTPCSYNSDCASITITVNQKSSDPTSATASANTICNGDPAILSLNGGGGGTGEVIKWYSTSCGVGYVGTGNDLSVSPTATTTYWGRYENGTPCSYNTACVSVTITVNQKSANPTSATATLTTICIGGSTTLTLNGGGGGTGEVIKWYSTSCGTRYVGTGNDLSVSPTSTTTYWGRYEDGAPCSYNSACVSVTITVNQLPTTSNAGPDQVVCTTTATLAGNTVGVGSGAWTVIAGSATVTYPGFPTSGVTGLSVGINKFVWTISNGVCDPSTDTVIIIRTLTAVTVTPPSQQYSDKVSFEATITPSSIAGLTPPTTVNFYVGTRNMGSASLVDIGGGILKATLSNIPLLEPPYPGDGQIAPGVHTVTAKFSGQSAGFTACDATTSLTITKEDALVFYNGSPYFSTNPAPATVYSAYVTLSATIKDSADGNGGDIRNATVTFRLGSVNGTILGTANLPVQLLDPTDSTIGTVATSFTYTLNNSEVTTRGTTLTVYAVVNNYYKGDNCSLPAQVTISIPASDAVTGGGTLLMTNSIGTYAGTSGIKTNFGFTMQWNKAGTNVKGQCNVIIRSNNHTYQVKSNAINNLSTSGQYAHFTTKANLTDVTNPLAPVSLGGNLDLIVDMNDASKGGQLDELYIQLKNGSTMLYSSHWNGTMTVRKVLSGGNVNVRNGSTGTSAPLYSGSQKENSNVGDDQVTDNKLLPFRVLVYPNPSENIFSLNIQSDKNDPVHITVYDITGKQVYHNTGAANQVHTFGSGLIRGTYIVEVRQGIERSVFRVTKQ